MKSLLSLLFLVGFPVSAEPLCTDFFQVSRPLIPRALNHEFIASRTEREIRIFGLTKGQADRKYAQTELLSTSTSQSVKWLGQVCGRDRAHAIADAQRRSDRWNRRYGSGIRYYARMLATPLLGRPCSRAAQSIARGISAYFQKF